MSNNLVREPKVNDLDNQELTLKQKLLLLLDSKRMAKMAFEFLLFCVLNLFYFWCALVEFFICFIVDNDPYDATSHKDHVVLSIFERSEVLKKVLLEQIDKHSKEATLEIQNGPGINLGLTLYGPLVVDVVTESVADQRGIKCGDLILSINGVDIYNEDDRFLYITSTFPEGLLELRISQLPANGFKMTSAPCKRNYDEERLGSMWIYIVKTIFPFYKYILNSLEVHYPGNRNSSMAESLLKYRIKFSRSRAHLARFIESIQHKALISVKQPKDEKLGITRMGTFIVAIKPNSIAFKCGLKTGDQIQSLKYSSHQLISESEVISGDIHGTRLFEKHVDFVSHTTILQVGSFEPWNKVEGFDGKEDVSVDINQELDSDQEYPASLVIYARDIGSQTPEEWSSYEPEDHDNLKNADELTHLDRVSTSMNEQDEEIEQTTVSDEKATDETVKSINEPSEFSAQLLKKFETWTARVRESMAQTSEDEFPPWSLYLELLISEYDSSRSKVIAAKDHTINAPDLDNSVIRDIETDDDIVDSVNSEAEPSDTDSDATDSEPVVEDFDTLADDLDFEIVTMDDIF